MAAAASIRHAGKLKKLKLLMQKLMALLKCKRAKGQFKGVQDSRIDSKSELKSGTMLRNKYSNIKEIELDSKGRFRDKHGDLRTNAGPNAPEFNKWKAKGGTIKYDDTTDTVIYGKPSMETASMGKIDVEVSYKSSPPDWKRYPDFSSYSKENVEIQNMKGIKEKYVSPPESGDFSKAWEELSKQKGDEYIEDNFDMSRRVKGVRKGQWPDKSPEDYTWHHHGNKSKMQLVDEEIHDKFTHKGGASASR